MGDEFILRPRMSRIYWNKKFLDYPLNGRDVVKKLGPVELTRSVGSYLWAAVKPKGKEETFEDWVSNRFGRRLFELFFRSYTEKVWGVPTSELRAEWAAQRIKGLSFFSAAKAAFFGNEGNKVKSLIQEFHYPRYGPGQMWETMTDEIRALGGEVRLESPVERIVVEDGVVRELVVAGGERIEPGHVISSLPLRTTVAITEPHAPGDVAEAARGLRYRDFLTVALVLDGEDLFPDNWIYIHDPSVRVGRIQNYRSWSPWMVPDESKACVGLEYFCFAGDRLWTMADEDLVAFATRELGQTGLADPSSGPRPAARPWLPTSRPAATRRRSRTPARWPGGRPPTSLPGRCPSSSTCRPSSRPPSRPPSESPSESPPQPSPQPSPQPPSCVPCPC